MKKTSIALGVIIAIGAVWTGGAWYTGKQLESKRDQILQDANAQLAKSVPELGLKAQWQNYQRGFFTSHASPVIQASAQTRDNPLIKPGQSIVLNEVIDHGPFPLAQLKQFNLIPSMASINTRPENTEVVKPLFALTGGKSPAEAETRVGYNGATDTRIALQAMDYQNAGNGERFATNGGTLNVSADAEGNQLSFDSHLGSLAATVKGADGVQALLTLNGTQIKGDTHLSRDGVRIGNQTLSIDKFSASANGSEALVMEKIDGGSNFDDKEGQIGGEVTYNVGKIVMQKQNFGEAKVRMTVAKLDGKAMKTFSENYQKQLQALLQQPGVVSDPVRYQQGIHQIVMANLPILLKGSPSISIAPISWKNGKGESTFNLTANFNDPATVTGEPQNLGAQVDTILKNLDAKLAINTPMATEVVRQTALGEGYKEEDAQKLADQQVKGLAAMGTMFRLTTTKDDSITSSLQYSAGQVTLNGNKIPLEQFLTRFMLGGAGGTGPVTPQQ